MTADADTLSHNRRPALLRPMLVCVGACMCAKVTQVRESAMLGVDGSRRTITTDSVRRRPHRTVIQSMQFMQCDSSSMCETSNYPFVPLSAVMAAERKLASV